MRKMDMNLTMNGINKVNPVAFNNIAAQMIPHSEAQIQQQLHSQMERSQQINSQGQMIPNIQFNGPTGGMSQHTAIPAQHQRPQQPQQPQQPQHLQQPQQSQQPQQPQQSQQAQHQQQPQQPQQSQHQQQQQLQQFQQLQLQQQHQQQLKLNSMNANNGNTNIRNISPQFSMKAPFSNAIPNQQNIILQNNEPILNPNIQVTPRSHSKSEDNRSSVINESGLEGAQIGEQHIGRATVETPQIPRSGRSTSNQNTRFYTSSGNPSFQKVPNDAGLKLFKRNLGNAGILRLMAIFDQISMESMSTLSSVEYWTKLLNTHCSAGFTARFNILDTTRDEEEDKALFNLNNDQSEGMSSFEMNIYTFPKFLETIFKDSKMTNIAMFLSTMRFQILNNGFVFILSKFFETSSYLDGSNGEVTATLKVMFNRDFKIECLDWHCIDVKNSLSVDNLGSIWNKCVNDAINSNTFDVESLSSSLFDSKSFNDTDLGSRSDESSKKLYAEKFVRNLRIPSDAHLNSKSSGIPSYSLKVMKVIDVMSKLAPLMSFTEEQQNTNSPLEALELYVSEKQNNQQTDKRPSDFTQAPYNVNSNDSNTNKRRKGSTQDVFSPN